MDCTDWIALAEVRLWNTYTIKGICSKVLYGVVKGVVILTVSRVILTPALNFWTARLNAFAAAFTLQWSHFPSSICPKCHRVNTWFRYRIVFDLSRSYISGNVKFGDRQGHAISCCLHLDLNTCCDRNKIVFFFFFNCILINSKGLTLFSGLSKLRYASSNK